MAAYIYKINGDEFNMRDILFPSGDCNDLTSKQMELLNSLCYEVAMIVVQKLKSNIRRINITKNGIMFRNKQLTRENFLSNLAYIKDDYEFNSCIIRNLIESWRNREFNEMLGCIAETVLESKKLKRIILSPLKENIANLINYRVSMKDSCIVYVYSNNGWDNPNIQISSTTLIPYGDKNNQNPKFNCILLSSGNIVNVLLGIKKGYEDKYATIYRIFLDIIKKIYSKDKLQARYYYLNSYYKQPEYELNPYNYYNLDKFILIDKNLYLYYHRSLQLLSDRLGINSITKECFPNINQESLKYFFNRIAKKCIYQCHSFESSMNNQFYGLDFQAIYEENQFCIRKTDDMSLITDDMDIFDLPNLINLHKHIPIRYKDFIMFDIKSYIETIKKFIILLGSCMQFSINTLKQIAVLKAKCHLRCKIKDKFYIIYAPDKKSVIVRILNIIFDNNFKISLKDIGKSDQLIKIQAAQTTSCALIAVDEKLPTRYKYSYLESLIKGNQLVIQDKYLENIFVKNHLPIIYVTDNVSNIDTINRCMDKKAEIIAFGNIPVKIVASDNVPIKLNKYISSLFEKEEYVNVIRYFNVCLTLYGIKLYLNKYKGVNKCKVIDNNFVVRDFINTCCTVQDNCYIEFTEFYEIFSQFFKEKYDSKVMKRVELTHVIEAMNIKYHRPHHSRNNNPYCISGLKFKENVLDLIHNCHTMNSKISDYSEYVLSKIFLKEHSKGILTLNS